MKITFNLKEFIFILLFVFSIFLLLLTNLSTVIFSEILITKEKKKEYDLATESFINFYDDFVKQNERLLNEIIRLSKDKSIKKDEIIESIWRFTPWVRYYIIFDEVGYIKDIYPFRKDAIGLYLGDTPIFKKSTSSQISGPYLFLLDRNYYYIQSLSYNRSKIVAFIEIPDFNSFFFDLLKKGFNGFLVDSSGNILAHYNEKFVKERANIKMYSTDIKNISEIKEPKRITIEDEEYLIFSRYIPQLNSYIFIGNQYKQAFAGYYIFRDQLLGSILVFVLLSFLISISISRFFERQFRIIFNTITEIEKHNYNFLPEKTSFKEFNSLIMSLYDMGKAILERESKLLKIFETSKDAIVLSTFDGAVIEINPAALSMFGLKSKDDIKNVRTLDLYFNPDERTKIINILNEKGFCENIEIKFKRIDGQIFYGLLTSSVVKDEYGKSLFIVSTVKDITEKRKMQEQLFQAQKMESIGRLAGSIAHDLNNMLTVINSNNQLIKIYTKDDPKVTKYTDGITTAVNKTKDFIKNLLAFSKRQVLEFKSYDINDVIKEEIKLLKPTIREDISLELETFEQPLYVSLDRTQFTQLLLNLIVNAIDAMPDGGIIKIKIGRKKIDKNLSEVNMNSKEGDFVCIEFSDTGSGISPDIIDKIFDPFFTTKEHGTGLGLSTVLSITQQHNGFINVYSEIGIGTTFRIYFPITEETQISQEILQDELKFNKKKIILIEDNEAVRESVKELLQKYGFEVFSFSNGFDLLEKFDQYKNNFEFCLSDVIMPGINGLELYKKLKEIKPDIKFILMTGYADNIDIVKDIINEGIIIISKPFSIEEFARKIKDIT